MKEELLPETSALLERLEAGGWKVTKSYRTGCATVWAAEKFAKPGDPLCPPTDREKVLVQYTAGNLFDLAKTCGISPPEMILPRGKSSNYTGPTAEPIRAG